jgi:hypothetical protein
MTTRKSEYKECLAFYKWAQFNPLLREYLIKIVNEGARSPQSGYFLKLIGMRPGIPDYFLPLANDTYSGLWLEMKLSGSQGERKRDNQSAWIERLKKIGHYATYAHGWQEAADIASKYLANQI